MWPNQSAPVFPRYTQRTSILVRYSKDAEDLCRDRPIYFFLGGGLGGMSARGCSGRVVGHSQSKEENENCEMRFAWQERQEDRESIAEQSTSRWRNKRARG
jgi:hypothetical protein